MCSFSKTCMPTTVRDVHIDIDPYYFKPSQPFIFSVLLQGTWVLLSKKLVDDFQVMISAGQISALYLARAAV